MMRRQSSGAIVNLSSVAALMGLDTVPHYSAAKGGILALTRAVAREVASRGIRVNAICPGYIDTPMTRADLGAVAQGDPEPHADGPRRRAARDRATRPVPGPDDRRSPPGSGCRDGGLFIG